MKRVLMVIILITFGMSPLASAQGVIFAGEDDLAAFDKLVKTSRKSKKAKSRVNAAVKKISDKELVAAEKRRRKSPNNRGVTKDVSVANDRTGRDSSSSDLGVSVKPPKGNERIDLPKNPGGGKGRNKEKRERDDDDDD